MGNPYFNYGSVIPPNKHYINEVGTEIVIDCGQDITAASVYKIEVRKPDNTLVEWAPPAVQIYQNNFLLYLTVLGDFGVPGRYALQPYIEMDAWKGRGQTVFFDVYNYYDGD